MSNNLGHLPTGEKDDIGRKTRAREGARGGPVTTASGVGPFAADFFGIHVIASVPILALRKCGV